MEEIEKHIGALLSRASSASQGPDAMHFSQAAVNAANAFCAIQFMRKETGQSLIPEKTR